MFTLLWYDVEGLGGQRERGLGDWVMKYLVLPPRKDFQRISFFLLPD